MINNVSSVNLDFTKKIKDTIDLSNKFLNSSLSNDISQCQLLIKVLIDDLQDSCGLINGLTSNLQKKLVKETLSDLENSMLRAKLDAIQKSTNSFSIGN